MLKGLDTFKDTEIKNKDVIGMNVKETSVKMFYTYVKLLEEDENLQKAENKVLLKNYERYSRERRHWSWIS